MPRLSVILRSLLLLMLAGTLQVGSYAQFPAPSAAGLPFAASSATRNPAAVVQIE